jgi:hypothetical protein
MVHLPREYALMPSGRNLRFDQVQTIAGGLFLVEGAGNVPRIVEKAVGGLAAGQTSSAVKVMKPKPPTA